MEFSYNYSYMIFILGYDLLHDYFANSEEPECDIAFEKCVEIYEDFLASEYNNINKSEYECLEEYCQDKFDI